MADERERLQRPWWYVTPPPWWLWPLFVAADAGTGVWRAISGSGHPAAVLFLLGLLWPGLAVAMVVFAVAWLGWSLDLG
jgi:hypothetical protein